MAPINGNDFSNLKPEVKVKDTNININNPNVSVPADSLTKGLANIGVGAAVSGGMNATANIVKSVSLPPAIKFSTVVADGAGGAAAGLIVTATNAANSITQNKINSYLNNGNTSTGNTNTGSTTNISTGRFGESSNTTGITKTNTTVDSTCNTSVDSTTNIDVSTFDIDNNILDGSIYS
jgi:hypothetical protein